MEPSKIASLISGEARRLGFLSCGFSKADKLDDEERYLEQWLNKGMHGKMQYMENHFDKRVDPSKLVDGAKTVISLLYNYYSPTVQEDPEAPKVSRYAYGKDYHQVIKAKLKELTEFIRQEIGNVSGRAFVDSAPVLERAWARKSGLGWVGKNTNLITRERGSYFFLAELIVDLDIPPTGSIGDYCGTCTMCIDACPTGAIVEPYVVDGSKCISYITIELRDEIPAEFAGKMENWAFGCDICQEVCPWNSFARKHDEPLFEPGDALKKMGKGEWLEITEEIFEKVFSDSPLQRTGYNGLMRNLSFLEKPVVVSESGLP